MIQHWEGTLPEGADGMLEIEKLGPEAQWAVRQAQENTQRVLINPDAAKMEYTFKLFLSWLPKNICNELRDKIIINDDHVNVNWVEFYLKDDQEIPWISEEILTGIPSQRQWFRAMEIFPDTSLCWKFFIEVMWLQEWEPSYASSSYLESLTSHTEKRSVYPFKKRVIYKRKINKKSIKCLFLWRTSWWDSSAKLETDEKPIVTILDRLITEKFRVRKCRNPEIVH